MKKIIILNVLIAVAILIVTINMFSTFMKVRQLEVDVKNLTASSTVITRVVTIQDQVLGQMYQFLNEKAGFTLKTK